MKALIANASRTWRHQALYLSPHPLLESEIPEARAQAGGHHAHRQSD
jgi:hypothetical protein